MDKDKVVNALNAIQNGAGAGQYHEELEVAIGVLVEASDLLIAAVVAEIHEDAQAEN